MIRHVDIQVNERGFGKIVVDGQELKGVESVSFEVKAGETPKVVVTFAALDTSISTKAKVKRVSWD